MSQLYRQSIRGDKVATDEESGAKVFHASDSHSFIQAAGYLKYIHARDYGETVYYRGQKKLYSRLSPTLFRGVTRQITEEDYVQEMEKYIEDICKSESILSSVPSDVIEPLLQHYGLRTTWIDLVDNIWIALWFACHSAYATGPTNEYLHFEKRKSKRETDLKQYAYVVLVAVGTSSTNPVPGLRSDQESKLVDLRLATPSIFVRPHAQHGLLFKLKRERDRRKVDYSSAIAGIIRVNLDDAFKWLGSGKLLNTHSLFPPPHYDRGYKFLLQDAPQNTKRVGNKIGGIHYIGA